MTWLKHLGITLFFALIMIAVFFVHGEFFLQDSIVPAEGITIESWIESYEVAGLLASLLGVGVSAIWFFIGNNHNGGSGIAVKYLLLFVLALILGGVTNLLLESAIDGAGFAKFCLPIGSGVVYYLSSLFASADSVKNIPPMSDFVH